MSWPWGRKHLRPFGDGGVVDLVHAVGRYLGDKHFSAMRARLWSKGAYTRVMTSRNKNSSMKSICPDKIRPAPRQDGGRYAQAHDHAGGIDEQSGGELAPDGDFSWWSIFS